MNDELKQAIEGAIGDLAMWQIYYALWYADGWDWQAMGWLNRPHDHSDWGADGPYHFRAGWELGRAWTHEKEDTAETIIEHCKNWKDTP